QRRVVKSLPSYLLQGGARVGALDPQTSQGRDPLHGREQLASSGTREPADEPCPLDVEASPQRLDAGSGRAPPPARLAAVSGGDPPLRVEVAIQVDLEGDRLLVAAQADRG